MIYSWETLLKLKRKIGNKIRQDDEPDMQNILMSMQVQTAKAKNSISRLLRVEAAICLVKYNAHQSGNTIENKRTFFFRFLIYINEDYYNWWNTFFYPENLSNATIDFTRSTTNKVGYMHIEPVRTLNTSGGDFFWKRIPFYVVLSKTKSYVPYRARCWVAKHET